MSKRSRFWKKVGAIVAAVSALAATASSIFDWVTFAESKEEKLVVEKTDRFWCELKLDPNRGKDIWTVMYDNDKGIQPWLGMVIPMGGGWTEAKRCDAIADRLENFRQDGLQAIDFRSDPNTPRQEVICVKTQLSGEGCPLLLTLDVDVDGYGALRDITGGLRKGAIVYQSDSDAVAANSRFSRESPIIYLTPYLAAEDRNIN